MSIALAFVVEIVIGGILCSCWLLLLINKILGYGADNIVAIINSISGLGLFGLFIALVLIYVIGWLSQYIGDLIFDRIQSRFSYKPFLSKVDFNKARSLVFQFGSKTIVDDIQLDRQILRISKLVCLNCAIIGLIIWLYANTIWAICLIVSVGCLIMSVLSFFHWKKRFSDTTRKFYGANETLLCENKKK